jgi:O-antigen/teichoic acid export membrane protein
LESTTTAAGVLNAPRKNQAVARDDAAGRDRMAWNVLVSWGGHAVFVAAGFVMPRLIDSHLGQVSLGLWDFGWSLVSYFVLAQLGVASSVNRYVARHRAAGDVAGLNRTLSSVNVIQMVATLIALVTAGLIMWLLPVLFGDRIGVQADTARWMIGFLGASVAMRLLFDVFGGVLSGCHRWDIHNGVTAGAYAVITTGMVIALVSGGGLRALSAVYFAGTLAGELVRMRLAYRTCPEMRLSPSLATWAEIKTLIVFGGKTVVDNLSRLVLAQANSILVVSYLGPGALAVYARPGALVRHADTLTNKFGMVLTPAASSLQSGERFDELKGLLIQSTRFASFLAMPITVFLAVMGDPILQVWMGPAYREGRLMAVMAIGTALPLTQRPASHVLIGLNAHGRIGWASFVVAWVGVAAAIVALGPLNAGLVGAALALVVPYTLGNGVFVIVYTCRKIGISITEFCRRSFTAPILCAIPLTAALMLVRRLFANAPLIALVVGVAVSALLLAPMFWLLVLPERLREKITRRLLRRSVLRPSDQRSPSVVPTATASDRVRSESAVQSETPIALRTLPYPYRSAMAICSDLDETPDRRVYVECSRYLNTTGHTSMGRGVGLEVGNTIYFDMPADQFAYWNTDDQGRGEVRALIRSGHIDCLHSFGDYATTRAHAARALDDLERHRCRLEVWIDHAVAPTNFGADIMAGSGDVPDAEVYHADLTHAFGVRFVWRGRVTSVTGQEVPRRLSGIWEHSSPLRSGRTLTKETVKGLIGRVRPRYAMHPVNKLVREETLRDNRPVYEFLRSNPHPFGVSVGDTAAGLADVLTPVMLDRLIEREASTIIYTHLGKVRSSAEPFEAATRAALERLARFKNEGIILVTTTRRLLGYTVARQRVHGTMRSVNGEIHIDAHLTRDRVGEVPPEDLQGLTFYVTDAARARLFVEGKEVSRVQRNPPDSSGRPSITIPWVPLEFPFS